jgi:hypothetical protein
LLPLSREDLNKTITIAKLTSKLTSKTHFKNSLHFFVTMKIQLVAALLLGTVATQAYRLPKKQDMTDKMVDAYSQYLVRLPTPVFDYYFYLESWFEY